MIITYGYIKDILEAEKEINKKYDNNLTTGTIIDYTISEERPQFKLSLRVKDTNGKGARIGFMKEKSTLACFHAHYDFFNILIEINPNIVINTIMDWIIKMGPNSKIIGNPSVLTKNMIHQVKPNSYMCRCKKG